MFSLAAMPADGNRAFLLFECVRTHDLAPGGGPKAHSGRLPLCSGLGRLSRGLHGCHYPEEGLTEVGRPLVLTALDGLEGHGDTLAAAPVPGEHAVS